MSIKITYQRYERNSDGSTKIVTESDEGTQVENYSIKQMPFPDLPDLSRRLESQRIPDRTVIKSIDGTTIAVLNEKGKWPMGNPDDTPITLTMRVRETTEPKQQYELLLH